MTLRRRPSPCISTMSASRWAASMLLSSASVVRGRISRPETRCMYTWERGGFHSTYLELTTNLLCSDQRLDLIPLVSSPSWQFDKDNLWRLPGAHGEEVVRSIYLDEQVRPNLLFYSDGLVANKRCSFRVNRSSLAVRTGSCGHGNPLMATIPKVRPDLRRPRGRIRSRKIGSSRTRRMNAASAIVFCCVALGVGGGQK